MIYWIWLTQIPQIGPVLANRLLEKFETPDEIYKADAQALQTIKGISRRQIENIQNFKLLDKAEEILKRCKNLGISILTKKDSYYPKKAKILEDAPVLLYYQGILKDISCSVGIVGARRCNQDIKKHCVEITEKYIQQNIPVISGMAKGIDACAGTVWTTRSMM